MDTDDPLLQANAETPTPYLVSLMELSFPLK